MSTLRHEYTHGLFSNWNLQNIKVSRSKKRRDLDKKKKELLESEEKENKKEWFENLIMVKSESDNFEMKASNSWIVEGLATYCETYPIGKRNDRWLYIFQKMIKEDEVYPIEVLTFYKIGSFPGMCPQAAVKAP